MSFGAIFMLSVGLALDATAVSAARGMAAPRVLPRHVVLVALFFGGFQALMPMLGWVLGQQVGPLVRAWDHWIAFALLGGIGTNMLLEARRAEGGPALGEASSDSFTFRALFVLAVATSIDALAVGVTLPMLSAPFALSLVTIGVTTAVLSAFGVLAGKRFGALFGKRLDALGGLVLLALGTKILIEHLSDG